MPFSHESFKEFAGVIPVESEQASYVRVDDAALAPGVSHDGRRLLIEGGCGCGRDGPVGQRITTASASPDGGDETPVDEVLEHRPAGVAIKVAEVAELLVGDRALAASVNQCGHGVAAETQLPEPGGPQAILGGEEAAAPHATSVLARPVRGLAGAAGPALGFIDDVPIFKTGATYKAAATFGTRIFGLFVKGAVSAGKTLRREK